MIPETVSLLELKSDELLVLKSFQDKSNNHEITRVVSTEFDWSITLIDIISKIVGAILSFLGILWSIYVWNHNRKKKLE